MSAEKSDIAILKHAYETWVLKRAARSKNGRTSCGTTSASSLSSNGATGLEFTQKGDEKGVAAEYFAGLTNQLEMIHYNVDE